VDIAGGPFQIITSDVEEDEEDKSLNNSRTWEKFQILGY